MREAAHILTCTPRVYLADYDFVLWASIGPRFLEYPKRASPSHGNWEKQITQTIHKGMFICCLKIFICCLKVFICCLRIFIFSLNFFVTNFVTCITNFVICVSNFVTSVTNFVTKNFKEKGKIICAEREKYKAEKKNCHIWQDLFRCGCASVA